MRASFNAGLFLTASLLLYAASRSARLRVPQFFMVTRLSEKDRRQVSALGFVVETGGHQRHLVHELQLCSQTPAEDLVITRRQQEARPAKLRRRADQRHQALVRLGHAVTDKANARRVAGNPAA